MAVTGAQDLTNLIMMDTGTNRHVVAALNKIENPQVISPPLEVSTASGYTKSLMQGNIPGSSFKSKAILLQNIRINLCSFQECIKDGFEWRYEKESNIFILQKESIPVVVFKRSPIGYIADMAEIGRINERLSGEDTPAISLNLSSGNAHKQFHSQDELSRAAEVMAIHKANFCMPFPAIAELFNNNTYSDCHLTARDVQVCVETLDPCPHCLYGRQRQKSKQINTEEPARKIGEHLHGDLIFFGKGNPYFICIDGQTNFANGVKNISKSEGALKHATEAITNYYAKLEHCNRPTWHFDREPGMVALANKNVIKAKFTGPNQHEKRIESWMSHARPRLRAKLHSLAYTLPLSLYGYLMDDYCKRSNQQVNRHTKDATPMQIVVGKKPSFRQSILNDFGTMGSFIDPHSNISEIGIIIGHEASTPTNLKVYFPATKTYATRKSYKRCEDQTTIRLLNEQANFEKQNTSKSDDSLDIDLFDLAEDNPSEIEAIAADISSGASNPEDIATPESLEEVPNELPTVSPLHNSTPASHQYNTRGRTVPKQLFADAYITSANEPPFQGIPNTLEEVAEELIAMLVDVTNLSIKEAYSTFESLIVEESIKTELYNLVKYKVWKEIRMCELTPEQARKILPSKLFLKLKYHASGAIDKLKSRLVVGGHRQKPGTFGRTTAPTVDSSNILLALQLAVQFNMLIGTVDIPAAYLNSDLKEDVFVRLTPEITQVYVKMFPEAKQFVDSSTNCITVKLSKSMYGLKQAAADWNQTLTAALLAANFKQSTADKCVFYKGENETRIWVLTHVDDLLVVAQQQAQMEELEKVLSEKFSSAKINTSSPTYLGLQIDKTRNGIKVSQPGYAKQACDKYNIQQQFKNPSNESFFSSDDTTGDYSSKATAFKSKLATILYLAIHTRPDILKEVIFLASISNNPGPVAEAKLNRVYGYVLATVDKGIYFTKMESDDFYLNLYADASFAVHNNGRSHSGVILCFGKNGAPIIAKSKMQSLVSLSSTEAELFALVYGVQLAQPIVRLVHELGILNEAPIIIHQDNQSAITIAIGGEGFSGKSRHMRVRYHFLCEMLSNGEIKIVHCNTENMRADILTKPMGGSLFQKQSSSILNLENSSLENRQKKRGDAMSR